MTHISCIINRSYSFYFLPALPAPELYMTNQNTPCFHHYNTTMSPEPAKIIKYTPPPTQEQITLSQ